MRSSLQTRDLQHSFRSTRAILALRSAPAYTAESEQITWFALLWIETRNLMQTYFCPRALWERCKSLLNRLEKWGMSSCLVDCPCTSSIRIILSKKKKIWQRNSAPVSNISITRSLGEWLMQAHQDEISQANSSSPLQGWHRCLFQIKKNCIFSNSRNK